MGRGWCEIHRLQDPAEHEYISCDKYLEQVPVGFLFVVFYLLTSY